MTNADAAEMMANLAAFALDRGDKDECCKWADQATRLARKADKKAVRAKAIAKAARLSAEKARLYVDYIKS